VFQSKLTHLATELLNRHRRPRVLDYAVPEPSKSLRDYWEDVVDWFWGYPCLLVFVAGFSLFVASFFVDSRRFAIFLGSIGGVMVNGAYCWWAARRPTW
jgi:hypothetical protein